MTSLDCSPGTGLRRAREAGFSLAEVAMAVAVLSFSLVTLLALVPAAMNMFRESIDNTVRAQIQQRLAAEVALLDYTNLVVGTGTASPFFTTSFPRYFGEDGQPTNSTFAVFTVGPYTVGGTQGVFEATVPGGRLSTNAAVNVIFSISRSQATNVAPFYFSVMKANDGR